jgi:acyl carrier protein
MIEFLDIFNHVAKVARPAHSKVAIAETMEDTFQEIGLDSLDGLVMLMYFDDIYGIDDAVSKEWAPTSVQELHDLVMANKTKEPASMEEVVEACK